MTLVSNMGGSLAREVWDRVCRLSQVFHRSLAVQVTRLERANIKIAGRESVMSTLEGPQSSFTLAVLKAQHSVPRTETGYSDWISMLMFRSLPIVTD